MKTIETIPALRATLAPVRQDGKRIGLVATMGSLHDGHLSLIRTARADCDVVVVSLFVNPTQFSDPADLASYPRDARGDGALAAVAGANILFAPPLEEIYPPGFSTTVSVAGVTDCLEGRHRGREHFQGVATVVVKLLNIVAPHVAYFGQKDAQQAQVIKRVVADLDLAVEIAVCPTVRAPDGLALSSRNARLSKQERASATGLHRALRIAGAAISDGERDPSVVRAAALCELDRAGIEPEYLELVDPRTFELVSEIDGEVLAVVAAQLGATRLIDNELVRAPLAAVCAGN